MALVAPVNLPYNIKTLWFDPNGIDIHADDKLVVKTARGLEMGVAAGEPFEVAYEEIKKLKSPLRPVERIATEEDVAKAAEMEEKSRAAMPVFKRLARETSEDMHPVSVEYLLDGDKAVFYFESEERIDFRDMVRKLAAEFHVRIDMRQIGVRDEARIVGGIAHCGQMVCCKRFGGEFKPVNIRMAKDQDLSLNPQKISGLCGRLMCCLRYENDVYKEYKAEAPKMDAKVATPEGEGRVVEYDVPRNMLAIRVGDEKPVKVPLDAIRDLSEDRKSAVVDDEAWDRAVEEAKMAIFGSSDLLNIPAFTGEDKLGEARAVHHEQGSKDKQKSTRRRSRGGSGEGSKSRRGGKGGSGSGAGSGEKADGKRTPRRRSTTIKADGETKKTSAPDGNAAQGQSSKGSSSGSQKQARRSGRGNGGGGGNGGNGGEQKLRPGHKSSGLAHDEGQKADGSQKQRGQRRRRRRRSGGGGGNGGNSGGGNGGGNGSASNS